MFALHVKTLHHVFFSTKINALLGLRSDDMHIVSRCNGMVCLSPVGVALVHDQLSGVSLVRGSGSHLSGSHLSGVSLVRSLTCPGFGISLVRVSLVRGLTCPGSHF
jgi:hypothetical protein